MGSTLAARIAGRNPTEAANRQLRRKLTHLLEQTDANDGATNL
jgi:hypothetical protein